MISTKICLVLFNILKCRVPYYSFKLLNINTNIKESEIKLKSNILFKLKILSAIIKFNFRKFFEKIKLINNNNINIKLVVIITVIQNKNLKIIFNKIYQNFLILCNDFINNNNFKFVYINNEQYNYNLVEYMCSYKKTDKFSILDFCSVIGISIPHFCYHPDLAIAGNCRMCLVQLEGSLKPIASCAFTISNKMIINTNSLFVKKIQEVF
jgi:hypothetical protein